VEKSRFSRVFPPAHSLDTVSPADTLLCFQLLAKELAKERVVLLRVQQVREYTQTHTHTYTYKQTHFICLHS